MKVELFEKARLLGEALLDSEEYRRLQSKQDLVNQNPEAQELFTQYNEMQKAVEMMLQQNEVDSVAMKTMSQRIEQCRGELQQLPDVIEMAQAQTDFQTLMNQVNQVIRYIITGELGDSNCTGDCSTCSSCATH